MSPSVNLLKLAVSPVGLKCLKYRGDVLKGLAVQRPILTTQECKQLEQLEFECTLSGQMFLRKMYQGYRKEALVT